VGRVGDRIAEGMGAEGGKVEEEVRRGGREDVVAKNESRRDKVGQKSETKPK